MKTPCPLCGEYPSTSVNVLDQAELVASDWSHRTFYRLYAQGIRTWGQLRRCSAGRLLTIDGLGRKSLQEIKWMLEEKGLELLVPEPGKPAPPLPGKQP
jgi:DNA-directed RNA polymerase alpha subunit